jgi:hypothetical protein
MAKGALDRQSFPELVEQLGIMRFGHRPRVADTFCGSGRPTRVRKSISD